jgi:hypothetical protein
LVTRTSGRPQILHVPAASALISACTGHVQTSASRTGTSAILQIGHAPAVSPTTSGCIGQVHESGGTGAWTGAAPAVPAAYARTAGVPITLMNRLLVMTRIACTLLEALDRFRAVSDESGS